MLRPFGHLLFCQGWPIRENAHPKTSHPLVAVGLGLRIFARVAENAKSRPMAAVVVWLRGQDLRRDQKIFIVLIFINNIFDSPRNTPDCTPTTAWIDGAPEMHDELLADGHRRRTAFVSQHLCLCDRQWHCPSRSLGEGQHRAEADAEERPPISDHGYCRVAPDAGEGGR
jgi:hypothetical protein